MREINLTGSRAIHWKVRFSWDNLLQIYINILKLYYDHCQVKKEDTKVFLYHWTKLLSFSIASISLDARSLIKFYDLYFRDATGQMWPLQERGNKATVFSMFYFAKVTYHANVILLYVFPSVHIQLYLCNLYHFAFEDYIFIIIPTAHRRPYLNANSHNYTRCFSRIFKWLF